jgi:outer membrane protein assembly factor BamB
MAVMLRSWSKKLPIVIAASVLFAPLGLILLWMRGGTGVVRKLFGTLLIAVVAIVEMKLIFGLRMELDGTGMKPMFSFGKVENHYAKIEQSRREAPAKTISISTPVPGTEPVKSAATTYWTDFRGPQRNGHYPGPISTKWPLEEVWRQSVGGGYASVVAGGGRIYTIEQRREREFVAAYDARTGREVWTHSYPALFQESLGGDGPRATPTYHDGLLHSLGASGEFRCLEAATGQVKWSKNILSDNQAANIQWGMSNSPLIVDEKVIVLPGGTGGKSVVAYNKLTGEPVWKSLDDKQSYTSPMLVTLGGRRQIIVVSAKRAVGLVPETGALLWEYPWVTEFQINSAQPIPVGENRFFISAGYDHGAALVELKPSGDKFEARTVWQNNRMKNKFSSSVLHDGYVYGLDEAILACVNVETGDLKWKGGRYGYGQLLLADGHLVVITETGELVLVKATPEGHVELARFPALEGKTWNVPAIDNGLLFVRNTTELAAYRIGR